MTSEQPTTWHLDPTLADDYARGRLGHVLAASVEQHLVACPDCRPLVVVPAPRLDRVWSEVLDAVESPPVPRLERVLRRVGVSGSTARLVASTPALTGACLTSLAAVLVMVLLAGRLPVEATTAFVALAPVMPLVGVALSFGRRFDPMTELVAATPYSLVRLLAARTTFVVGTALVPAALAAQLLPGGTWLTAGWLLPALAMCSVVLAAARRVEPLVTAATLSGLWLALTAYGAVSGQPVLREHTLLVQLVSLAALGAAAWAVTRHRLDLVTSRSNA